MFEIRGDKFDKYCLKCEGKFWHAEDNSATQRAVKQEFGVIPNSCVIGSTGEIRCPYVENRFSV